ncbi:Adenylate isopentenyltransferase 1, chloroplastic [Capsicum chinense]|nr:Adenylate isopentenyltransferase 1, chloroplastic [Capsicum chinense]
MGATASEKSKLSVDLVTRFFSLEIINSDKILVSKGLNITNNKISMQVLVTIYSAGFPIPSHTWSFSLSTAGHKLKGGKLGAGKTRQVNGEKRRH